MKIFGQNVFTVVVYVLISYTIISTHATNFFRIFDTLETIKNAAEGSTKEFLEFTRDKIEEVWKAYYISTSTTQNSFNLHAPYTIVLIGQTGSGKTSFLNLLLNINNIVELNHNIKTINTLRRYNDMKVEMEGEPMSSKTANCSIYDTTFHKYKMRIADTPGFGDSRGMHFDVEHRRNIIEVIKELAYVHCIILVINGRDSRMTTQLRYVIDDITSIMPQQIKNNIVVVFTNVDNIFNLNFNITSLKDYIRTDIKHYWYTENPICQLEKMQKNQYKDLYESNFIVEEDIRKSLQEAFEKTTKTILDMYNTISYFKPIHSEMFLKVYTLKENIEKQYLRLITQHYSLLDDIRLLNELEKKVKSHTERKEVFKNFNKTETFERTILVDTPYHNTLCAYSGCNHNCHEHCSLPLTLERGNPIFKGCAAMGEGEDCRICGHSYTEHYHLRSKYERVTETRTYIDPSLLKQFNEAKDDEERTSIALEGIRNAITKKENELKEIFEEIQKQIVEYQKLGLPKSYLRLLRSRLSQVSLTIETYTGDMNNTIYKQLLKSKEDLETKILYAQNMTETAFQDKSIEDNHDHDEPHDEL